MDNWEERLAIVILNYNGADLTITALNHIRRLSKTVKIIVIDNCSTDDSYSKLNSYCKLENVFFIENSKNLGYAAGNNTGIRFAINNLPGVDTICIMNPDIIVDKISDFKSLYDALWSDDKLSAITAITIYNDVIRMPNDFGWKRLSRKHMFFSGTLLGKFLKTSSRYSTLKLNDLKLAYVDIIQGCFFLIKKSTAEKIGLLDENTFLYQEEAILGKKIADAGYKEAVLTTVFIHHNHKEKEKSLVKRKNKLFDIKCFYDSRKYYIRHYSGESKWFINVSCAFLNLDLLLKRIYIYIKYKD